VDGPDEGFRLLVVGVKSPGSIGQAELPVEDVNSRLVPLLTPFGARPERVHGLPTPTSADVRASLSAWFYDHEATVVNTLLDWVGHAAWAGNAVAGRHERLGELQLVTSDTVNSRDDLLRWSLLAASQRDHAGGIAIEDIG
jgi:hypothetical protein